MFTQSYDSAFALVVWLFSGPTNSDDDFEAYVRAIVELDARSAGHELAAAILVVAGNKIPDARLGWSREPFARAGPRESVTQRRPRRAELDLLRQRDRTAVVHHYRSLIASCILHRINPELYMEELLRLAPTLAEAARAGARTEVLAPDPRAAR